MQIRAIINYTTWLVQTFGNLPLDTFVLLMSKGPLPLGVLLCYCSAVNTGNVVPVISTKVNGGLYVQLRSCLTTANIWTWCRWIIILPWSKIANHIRIREGTGTILSVWFQETFCSPSGSPVSNLRSYSPLLNDLILFRLCFMYRAFQYIYTA
jgi:hypothetical protein